MRHIYDRECKPNKDGFLLAACIDVPVPVAETKIVLSAPGRPARDGDATMDGWMDAMESGRGEWDERGSHGAKSTPLLLFSLVPLPWTKSVWAPRSGRAKFFYVAFVPPACPRPKTMGRTYVHRVKH